MHQKIAESEENPCEEVEGRGEECCVLREAMSYCPGCSVCKFSTRVHREESKHWNAKGIKSVSRGISAKPRQVMLKLENVCDVIATNV